MDLPDTRDINRRSVDAWRIIIQQYDEQIEAARDPSIRKFLRIMRKQALGHLMQAIKNRLEVPS